MLQTGVGRVDVTTIGKAIYLRRASGFRAVEDFLRRGSNRSLVRLRETNAFSSPYGPRIFVECNCGGGGGEKMFLLDTFPPLPPPLLTSAKKGEGERIPLANTK